jgi:hypothetical protein
MIHYDQSESAKTIHRTKMSLLATVTLKRNMKKSCPEKIQVTCMFPNKTINILQRDLNAVANLHVVMGRGYTR